MFRTALPFPAGVLRHPDPAHRRSRRRGVVGIFRLGSPAVFAAVVLAMVPAHAHAAQTGDFTVNAHRGYHVAVTENTVGALDAAAAAGATSMETDIRLTSDRQMIVMHDATLDRTTNCSGPVDERTRKWILDHCRADDGQTIPFASDLLEEANAQSMNLLTELKSDSQGRWDTTQMQTLANLIVSKAMAGRVMVSATDAARLRRVESVARWLPTMWIRDTKPTVSQVNSNGVDNVSASAANLSPGLVADLKAAGHLVYGRESNSQSDWEAYRTDGVAGIVTDLIPEYLTWSRNHA